MNKEDLINQITKSLPEIPKSKIKKALEGFILTISEALKKGEKVTLSGFGTFYLGQRKEKKGVNPRTKEAITIPAASVPKFRPGKKLREGIK